MSGPNQILTIAGRWKQHSQASGLEQKLPKRERTMAMLMFYAGFSAGLEAMNEIAALDEKDAVQLLQALHIEVLQLEAMATRQFAAGMPS